MQGESCDQTAKLDMVVWLTRHGWEADPHPQPLEHGGPKKFLLELRRPASYFLVLLKLDEVLGKGVASVPHDAVDYFYRCLLRLNAEQLEAVLRVGEATDEFYRKELKAGLPAIEDDGVGEEAAAADGNGAPVPIAGPLDVSGTRVWKRCLVSVPADADGDPPAHKVYFDSQLHSSGQRGFIQCPREDHGRACIMHCYTEGFGSRAEFAAAMHRWASMASGEGCATRSQHLCQRPTPEWGRPLPQGLHVRDF